MAVVDRVRRLAGAVLLVAIAFSQQPGRLVADTKLDLLVDPARFLGRALQAWDPQAAFGQIQNQAYGYLFPMGPFFWAGHAVGLPAWVVQRLWWAALLLVAYAGFCRLARLLGLGSLDATIVAALAYALGPRVVTELGAISAETLPLAVLPWVLIPLVRGSAGGSPRRAAAASGIAVACIGGVNAAATVAVLVVPVVWLATRTAGPRRRRLAGWWVVAVALASLWWVLPLLVLGRYAYPFLSYIESASVTTSVVSAVNVLRGADHWLAFLPTAVGPGWPAGWSLALETVPAAATVLVAGLGLGGLARRATPERKFLAWCLLAGLALVGLAYAGVAGAPLAGPVRSLLDGPLAPLRNVHKFDPVLRLALTLGLSVALTRVSAVARRLAARVRGQDGAWLRAHPSVAPAVAVGLVVLPLLVATGPAWTGRLAPPGSYAAIPAYWSATADWLAEHDEGRALLEPASSFAQYTWGRPRDEPLQALGRSPWAVRDSVPLGSPGATRLLDGVESLLATGRGSPDLAAALTRAGVRYVVLRNDLAPDAATTPPAVTRAALVASPGIAPVAAFGPPVATTASGIRGMAGPLGDRPAAEVFAVGTEPVPQVRLLTRAADGLSGGSEAMAGSLPLDPVTPYVALADGGPVRRVLATDTLRLRQRNMGAAATRAYGPTLPAGSDAAQGRPAADVVAYDGAQRVSTVALVGATAVTASSSASDAFATDHLGPGYQAYSAVDGLHGTSWVSDVVDRTPWLRVDLGRPVQLPGLVLDLGSRPPGTARPARVTVETAAGSWSGPVSTDRVTVGLPPLRTSWVVVRLFAAPGTAHRLALAEVEGLPPIGQSIVLPADSAGAGPGSTWAFVRQPAGRRACVDPGAGWVCSTALPTAPEENGPLDRVFASGAGTTVTPEVQVTPRQGAALDQLLDAASGVQVGGSSRYVADAADRPGAALDGDPATSWITDGTDASPRLTVTYPLEVTVTGLSLAAPQSSLDRVQAVVVQASGAGQAPVTARVGPDGAATFAAVTGRQVTVTLRLGPAGESAAAPLVVGEVRLTGAPAPAHGAVVLGCGAGPTVDLDGVDLPTRLTATAAAVLSGAPLPAVVCGPEHVSLPAGSHHLVGSSSGVLDLAVARLVTSLGGLEAGAGPAAPSTAEPEVATWGPEHRVVELSGPGGGTLTLDEGFNRGWQAQASGQTLVPVRVDGWRQGWVVPAGVSGHVVLTFTAGSLHRWGLGAGLAALVALLLLAARPGRRASDLLAPSPAAAGRATTMTVATAIVAVLLAGPVGLLAWLVATLLALRLQVPRAPAVLLGSAVLAVTAGLAAPDPTGHAWWWQALTQGLAVALVVLATGEPRVPRPARSSPG